MFGNVGIASHAGEVVNGVIEGIAINMMNYTTFRHDTKNGTPGHYCARLPRTMRNLYPHSKLAGLINSGSLGSNFDSIRGNVATLKFTMRRKSNAGHASIPRAMASYKGVGGLASGSVFVSEHQFTFLLRHTFSATRFSSDRLATRERNGLAANLASKGEFVSFHARHCTSDKRTLQGGSGTTAKMAKHNGRRYIGIEVNPEYVEISNERLSQGVLF